MSTGSNESASVINAYEGKKTAQKVKQSEEAANLKAEKWQREMYERNLKLLAPYQTAGEKSLATIQALQGYGTPEERDAAIAGFRNDPGYEFSVNQANKGLERSALRSGNMYSGNFASALQAQGMGMADQQYGNYYNRLWNTANMGRGTATGVANMSTQYGNTMGSLAQNQGQIESQNFWTKYNLMANAINTGAQGQQYTFDKSVNLASSYLGSKTGGGGSNSMMQQPQQQQYGGGGGYGQYDNSGPGYNYGTGLSGPQRYGSDYNAYQNAGY